MMNRFIEHIGNLYSIILTILTLFLGEHWILFMVLLLLNIIDTLTGWIKSRINNKENSMAGLKGIMKKLVQWILVLLSGMSVSFSHRACKRAAMAAVSNRGPVTVWRM